MLFDGFVKIGMIFLSTLIMVLMAIFYPKVFIVVVLFILIWLFVIAYLGVQL